MKSTGVVRRIDELGRIVLPKEIRRTLGIDEKDPLEIYVEEDRIILTKFSEMCTFCGQVKDLKKYKGKCVCSKCAKALAK